MLIALEIIGAFIVVGLLALGVERYIEFLKRKSTASDNPLINNPYIGETHVEPKQDRLPLSSGSDGTSRPDDHRR